MPQLLEKSKRKSAFTDARKLLAKLDKLYGELDDIRYRTILLEPDEQWTAPELFDHLEALFEDGYKSEWDTMLANSLDCASVYAEKDGHFDFLDKWAEMLEERIEVPPVGEIAEKLDEQLKVRARIIRRCAEELRKTVPTEFS